MRYKQIKQKGFTLIELMIVTVIIAILMSIALPTYQNYMAKTQIYSAYQEISNLKSPVDLMIYKSEDITSASLIGWPSGGTTLIRSDPNITIDSNGKITIKVDIDGNVQPLVKETTIQLIRNVSGGWSCIIDKPESTAWKDSFAPKVCQII